MNPRRPNRDAHPGAVTAPDRVASDVQIDDGDIAKQAAELIARLRRHGGGADGSVTRLTYTPAWRAAMAEVEDWFEESGLEPRVDAVGSRFGRLPGAEPQVVLTGSHVDSVPSGGAYDGALGVIMATCAIRWLAENVGTPRRTLEVFANCEEESSRFPGDLWGARAMLGLIAADEPTRLRDGDGVTIGAAMRDCGLDPDRIPDAARDDIATFIEPHIEQGTVLESSGAEVGLVDRVVGVRQLALTFDGVAGHAGTVPMRKRRDPLVGAARFVLAAREMAVRTGGSGVATVGTMDVAPGGANQVPGCVRTTVDFRHTDLDLLERMESELRKAAEATAGEESVDVSIETRIRQRPTTFDAGLLSLLESTCERQGRGYMWLPSGAGHDAQLIATRFPTAMIFLPSKDGHSHRPDEATAVEHAAAGIAVLTEALYRLAYEAT